MGGGGGGGGGQRRNVTGTVMYLAESDSHPESGANRKILRTQ